jgi:hypothetical protein
MQVVDDTQKLNKRLTYLVTRYASNINETNALHLP